MATTPETEAEWIEQEIHKILGALTGLRRENVYTPEGTHTYPYYFVDVGPEEWQSADEGEQSETWKRAIGIALYTQVHEDTLAAGTAKREAERWWSRIKTEFRRQADVERAIMFTSYTTRILTLRVHEFVPLLDLKKSVGLSTIYGEVTYALAAT